MASATIPAELHEPLTQVDPAADFRPLVEATRGSDCRILAGLTDNVESDRQGYVLPNKAPRPGAHPGAVIQLPAELEVDAPVRLRIPVSDDLARWDAGGRVHEVILRVRVAANTELDRLSFKFNGRELPRAGLRRINEFYRMKSLRQSGGAGSGYWYVFRLEREDWPVNGGNTLEVTLLERDPHVLPKAHVHFAELETRYLMGVNFHRGFVDPDLGPYEHTSM